MSPQLQLDRLGLRLSIEVGLGGGAVAAMVVAILAYLWWSIPLAVPVVESVTQLTNDNEAKGLHGLRPTQTLLNDLHICSVRFNLRCKRMPEYVPRDVLVDVCSLRGWPYVVL